MENNITMEMEVLSEQAMATVAVEPAVTPVAVASSVHANSDKDLPVSSTVAIHINHQAQGTLNTWLNTPANTGPADAEATANSSAMGDLSRSHRDRIRRLKRKSKGEGNPPPKFRKPLACKTISPQGRLRSDSKLTHHGYGFIVKNGKLYCSLCNKYVTNRSISIDQHLITKTHKDRFARRTSTEKQKLLMEASLSKHFRGARESNSTLMDVHHDR